MAIQELRLETRFIRQTLDSGLKKIFREQLHAAENNIYSRQSGSTRKSHGLTLKEALQNPQYSLSYRDGGVHAVITYPLHMRFLDMKRLGKKKVYNKHLWGILYRETFQDIRYTFAQWIHDWQVRSLSQAIQPLNT